VKLPRSSWRHRKEIEEAGQLEVRGSWQLSHHQQGLTPVESGCKATRVGM
jgi:hypothetical protein